MAYDADNDSTIVSFADANARYRHALCDLAQSAVAAEDEACVLHEVILDWLVDSRRWLADDGATVPVIQDHIRTVALDLKEAVVRYAQMCAVEIDAELEKLDSVNDEAGDLYIVDDNLSLGLRDHMPAVATGLFSAVTDINKNEIKQFLQTHRKGYSKSTATSVCRVNTHATTARGSPKTHVPSLTCHAQELLDALASPCVQETLYAAEGIAVTVYAACEDFLVAKNRKTAFFASERDGKIDGPCRVVIIDLRDRADCADNDACNEAILAAALASTSVAVSATTSATATATSALSTIRMADVSISNASSIARKMDVHIFWATAVASGIDARLAAITSWDGDVERLFDKASAIHETGAFFGKSRPTADVTEALSLMNGFGTRHLGAILVNVEPSALLHGFFVIDDWARGHLQCITARCKKLYFASTNDIAMHAKHIAVLQRLGQSFVSRAVSIRIVTVLKNPTKGMSACVSKHPHAA